MSLSNAGVHLFIALITMYGLNICKNFHWIKKNFWGVLNFVPRRESILEVPAVSLDVFF